MRLASEARAELEAIRNRAESLADTLIPGGTITARHDESTREVVKACDVIVDRASYALFFLPHEKGTK